MKSVQSGAKPAGNTLIYLILHSSFGTNCICADVKRVYQIRNGLRVLDLQDERYDFIYIHQLIDRKF